MSARHITEVFPKAKPLTDLFPGAKAVIAFREGAEFERIDLWFGGKKFLNTTVERQYAFFPERMERAFAPYPDFIRPILERGYIDRLWVLHAWPAEEVYLRPGTAGTSREGVILFAQSDGTSLVIEERPDVFDVKDDPFVPPEWKPDKEVAAIYEALHRGEKVETDRALSPSDEYDVTGRVDLGQWTLYPRRLLCVTRLRGFYWDKYVGCNNEKIERKANLALYPDVIDEKFEMLIKHPCGEGPVSGDAVAKAKSFILRVWRAAMEADIYWVDPLIGVDSGDIHISWEGYQWVFSAYVSAQSDMIYWIRHSGPPDESRMEDGEAKATDMEWWLSAMRWVEDMWSLTS